jgi:2,5-diketo-D-gluconate reductase A
MSIPDPDPYVMLRDGNRMPRTGFGTWSLTGSRGQSIIEDALSAGYRMLDTAQSYANEAVVGAAVTASGLPRGDVFLVTKVRGRNQGETATRRSVEASLAALGTDYLDLCLIHWPLPRLGRYVDTWRELVALHEEGVIRSIGVSNFEPDHLDAIQAATGYRPAVNQVEVHPHFPQEDLLAVHKRLDIVTQSWSPLAEGFRSVENPVVTAIARRHRVAPAQAILRWHIQRGCVPLTRSSSPANIRANRDIFSFVLDDEEMDRISGLASRRLWGGDPLVHEEF